MCMFHCCRRGGGPRLPSAVRSYSREGAAPALCGQELRAAPALCGQELQLGGGRACPLGSEGPRLPSEHSRGGAEGRTATIQCNGYMQSLGFEFFFYTYSLLIFNITCKPITQVLTGMP